MHAAQNRDRGDGCDWEVKDSFWLRDSSAPQQLEPGRCLPLGRFDPGEDFANFTLADNTPEMRRQGSPPLVFCSRLLMRYCF